MSNAKAARFSVVPIRRIVHATDFSPGSQSALAWAVRLARKNEAELVVVHVLLRHRVTSALNLVCGRELGR